MQHTKLTATYMSLSRPHGQEQLRQASLEAYGGRQGHREQKLRGVERQREADDKQTHMYMSIRVCVHTHTHTHGWKQYSAIHKFQASYHTASSLHRLHRRLAAGCWLHKAGRSTISSIDMPPKNPFLPYRWEAAPIFAGPHTGE